MIKHITPRVTVADRQAAEKICNSPDGFVEVEVVEEIIASAMHAERAAADESVRLLNGIAKRDHTLLKHGGAFKFCAEPFCKYRYNTIAAYREAIKDDLPISGRSKSE